MWPDALPRICPIVLASHNTQRVTLAPYANRTLVNVNILPLAGCNLTIIIVNAEQNTHTHTLAVHTHTPRALCKILFVHFVAALQWPSAPLPFPTARAWKSAQNIHLHASARTRVNNIILHTMHMCVHWWRTHTHIHECIG